MNDTAERIAVDLAALQRQLSHMRLTSMHRRLNARFPQCRDAVLDRATLAVMRPSAHYCHVAASEALDDAEAFVDRLLYGFQPGVK